MYRVSRVVCRFGFGVIVVLLLLATDTLYAQITIGDNLNMTLSGNLGYGYTGNFGNFLQSSHGQGFLTNANLDGYYFHPDFLNFDVRPYYNRAGSSSESQSITQGTGFNSSVGLFNGSYFPGSISYGMDWSDNSEFYVGGVPSLVGNSNSRHFNVSWSELLPHYPHVYLNFSTDNGRSTLLSTTEGGNSASQNLNLNTDYKLAGFDLRGTFTRNSNDFTSPEFLTGETTQFSGSGTTVGVQAQHKIPLGGVGFGYSHSSYDSNQGGGGSGNNFNESAGITLFRKLSLSQNFNYTTNTTAALNQALLNGATSILLPDRDSSGMFFYSTATLPVKWGLTLTGNYSRRMITFNGQEFTDDQYGGAVNFSRQMKFLGFLTWSVGFVDTANKEGNAGAGLVTTVGLNKKLGHWETSADFSYYQSVQTMFATTNTSSYGYGGSIRRRINQATHWSATYRGTHSGLTIHDGNTNKSDSAASSFSWKRYSLGGTYARSSGVAVLTSNGGLVSTPEAPLLSDFLYVVNAKTWGVNGSTRLFQRLTVSGGYTNIDSNTTTGQYGVLSSGDRYFTRFDYRLRRFSIQGGYSRVNQDVSTIPGGPRNINSYYVTFSRWFNVF